MQTLSRVRINRVSQIPPGMRKLLETWSSRPRDGFEKLPGYLERHLPDERLFPADTNRRIAAVLARLREWQSPLREDEPYDFLGDRVVDHYPHYGTRPHRRDPDLHR